MSLIEGIGDEVTLVFAVLVILVVGLLAWFSTHTSDIPFFSVIVVELSQRARNRNRTTNESENSQVQSTENDSSSNTPDNQRSITDVVSSALDNVNEALGLDRGALEEEEDSDDDDDDSSVEEDGDNAGDKEAEAAHSNTTSNDETSKVETVLSSSNASDASVIKSESDQVSETELRQRRVAFFESGPSKSLQSTSAVKQEDKAIPKHETEDNIPSGASHKSEEPRLEAEASQSNNDQSENLSPNENQIRVRLKYLNDTQRLVLARPLDTIGYFKRTHFPEELAQQKLVRLIYNGQDLRNETSTLQSCNVVDNSVLHCLVTQNVQTQPTVNPDHDDDINIGTFIIPIFGLLLGALWYLRFYYKQYFNATSTLSLAGISFLFVFAAFTSFRPHNRHHENHHLD